MLDLDDVRWSRVPGGHRQFLTMFDRKMLFVLFAFGAVAFPIEQNAASPDPYSTGVTLSSRPGCPVFVLSVVAHSSAEQAGVRPGDHILAIGGKQVQKANETARQLRSDQPGSVSVEFTHQGQRATTVIQREKLSAIYAQAGRKIVSGVIVPPDTSLAEVERMRSFDDHRFVGRLFLRTHYPRNPALFYGGFELFLLRDPSEVMVGGIEDGPAARAGVHWGDVVLTVNGQSTASQTESQLETLFSSTEPKMMHLQVDRLGTIRTFDFRLEQAAEIARQNGKQYIGDKVLPSWVSEKDRHCFE